MLAKNALSCFKGLNEHATDTVAPARSLKQKIIDGHRRQDRTAQPAHLIQRKNQRQLEQSSSPPIPG